MKKFLIACALAALSAAAFAQIDLGIGAGGFYSQYFYLGRMESSLAWSQSQSTYGFYGAKAFCDVTYVSADIGIMLNTDESQNTTTSSLASTTTTTRLNQGVWLDAGAIFKYPFKSGEATFYPLIGVEYDMLLAMYNADGDDIKSTLNATSLDLLNRLWVKAGFGADLDVGNRLFVRTEAEACYKVPSGADADQINLAKTSGYTATRNYFRVDLSLSLGVRL